MAEIIPADQLTVGDIYRNVAFGNEIRGEAFRVTERRTVKTVETYEVIEAVNVRTGNGASINLRSDVMVGRLERQSLADLKGYLDYMGDGESIHIVRHYDTFWA